MSGVSEGMGCRLIDPMKCVEGIVEIELSRVAWLLSCSMNCS